MERVKNQSKAKISNYRKKTWTFLCSHGKVMKVSDDFQFHPDNVGKSNVSIQRLKQTKSKGSTMRGEFCLLLLMIVCIFV